MKKIVLISCAAKKDKVKQKAKDFYLSDLFKKNLAYGRSFNPDKIFILSAKYNLLPLDREIEPYDLTLNNFKKDELKQWTSKTIEQLSKESDLQNDIFIILAGAKYRKYLEVNLKNKEIPMKGLPIGKQLQFLKKKLDGNNI
jgi:hypothetical protein